MQKVRTFTVTPSLPEPLEDLKTIANNLFWSWNPEFADIIAERALDYAGEYSWENQVQRHYELAERLIYPQPALPERHLSMATSLN